MSVEPREILALAERLHSEGSEQEVVRRAAISRAYYACFHECSLLANHLQLPRPPGTGEHKALSQALKGAKGDFAKTTLLGQLGADLHELKHLRTLSDYYLDELISAERVRIALGIAKDIMSTVRQLRSQYRL